MERLGRSMVNLSMPLVERHEILLLGRHTAVASRADCDLPTGADKGRWLIEFITTTWEALDRPLSERMIDHALACAERRIAAHDDERAGGAVHGDVHQWNTLESDNSFKLVDPDGLTGTRVRPRRRRPRNPGGARRGGPVESPHTDPRGFTALDPTAIWEWGVVERVSTGLLCTPDRTSARRQSNARCGHDRRRSLTRTRRQTSDAPSRRLGMPCASPTPPRSVTRRCRPSSSNK